MKRLFAVLIVFCVAVMCACDSRAVEQSIPNTENLQSNVEESVAGQQEEFSIVGKWEYGSAYHYFLEDGLYFWVGYENAWGERVHERPEYWAYSMENDVLTILGEGNESKFTYTFDGNQLTLTAVEDATVTRELIKCDVASYQYDLVGTWEIVGTGGEFESFRANSSNDYIRVFYFYNDGTYKAEWYFTNKGEVYSMDPEYGNYKFVNDGTVICFDNKGYYECNRLGYGLMELVEPDGNKIMYILR